jgi:uncharacterized protein YcsI (UPF0317 family)
VSIEEIDQERIAALQPSEFRAMIRQGKWTKETVGACRDFSHANLAIVPLDYAFEFLLFCHRNPRPCPVLEVTEPGDPHPQLMAPDADLRTDVPRYRIFREGELVKEPVDILDLWRDDLVCFLIGCSKSFVWAMNSANIKWRRYGAYRTNLPAVPAGRLHGPIAVTARAFFSSSDAVRAVQISSRHILMHGPPIHIGDPQDIGIDQLGQPDAFNPHRPIADPPKSGEIAMCWGCGITPQLVAMESKMPLMITHCPTHMFVTDRMMEELSVL